MNVNGVKKNMENNKTTEEQTEALTNWYKVKEVMSRLDKMEKAHIIIPNHTYNFYNKYRKCPEKMWSEV